MLEIGPRRFRRADGDFWRWSIVGGRKRATLDAHFARCGWRGEVRGRECCGKLRCGGVAIPRLARKRLRNYPVDRIREARAQHRWDGRCFGKATDEPVLARKWCFAGQHFVENA